MTADFKGSLVALVTPFKDGGVDEPAFREHVAWQVASGTNGLVPCGTTGESPTLSHDEHKHVVRICIEEARGRVPVIAGAGSNNTAEAIDLAVHAERCGANGLLVVTPYYNRPNQEGLFAHFKAVNDAVGIPIVIYNIPPRSSIDMSIDTMQRLYALRNIVGVKDSTANLGRVSLQRHLLGPEFLQLSGEDMTALAAMAAGGHGCISVTANVAPRACADLQAACLGGDYATALTIQDRLVPLHQALFVEPNPACPKHALSVLGRMSEDVRLPMVPVTEASRRVIRSAMAHAGLIEA